MNKAIPLCLICLFCGTSVFSNELPWDTYKQETLKEVTCIQGWCPKENATNLMDCIFQNRPQLCVEIGSFYGSTSFPIAQALAYNQEGSLYAIDAYDNKAAIEGLDLQQPCAKFWTNLPLQNVRESFLSLLKRKGLAQWVHPICSSSVKAVDQFADESIDLLYIDGNFSALGFLQDVLLYFPKVKEGGYIWITDGESSFKTAGVSFLMKHCTWVKSLSVSNRYIAFQKSTRAKKRTIHIVPSWNVDELPAKFENLKRDFRVNFVYAPDTYFTQNDPHSGSVTSFL